MDSCRDTIIHETPLEWAKRQTWNGLDRSFRQWNECKKRLDYMIMHEDEVKTIGFLYQEFFYNEDHEKAWSGIDSFENELRYLCFQEGLT